MNSKTKRGLSPLLAVVILLGVTVAAGGAVFSIYNQQAKGLDSNMSMRIDNAQANVLTEHGDFTATITNTGTQAWTEISVALHTGLGEHPPLLYSHGEDELEGSGLLATRFADANSTSTEPVLYMGTDLVASTEPLTVALADITECGTSTNSGTVSTGDPLDYNIDIEPVGPGEQIAFRMHLTVENQFDGSCNADLDADFGDNKWYAQPGQTVSMIVSAVGDQGGSSERIFGLPIRTI